jgi:hypothetical protein
VLFNFLGRDFFNALSSKDADAFGTQLLRYLGGFAVGVPVFVFKGYYQVCGSRSGGGSGGGSARAGGRRRQPLQLLLPRTPPPLLQLITAGA